MLEISKEWNRTSKCEYDCESFGLICCKFGYGVEECREEKNCLEIGKHHQVLKLIQCDYKTLSTRKPINTKKHVLLTISECIDREYWCKYYPDCSIPKTAKACPKLCDQCLGKEERRKSIKKFTLISFHMMKYPNRDFRLYNSNFRL